MISYAQNHEDVVLARLFRTQDSGFYVDVGAGHPVDDSVTKHFSDSGWRGVNIEPMEREHHLLERERPDDVNLRVALSDHVGEATLYEAPPHNRGASTLSPTIAQHYSGQVFTPVVVPTATLADVCDAHVADAVDFLKVDVEGHEDAVIRGARWDHFRPRVLVIEATEPGTIVAAHESWEPALLDLGYRCALFDGLNRFYAQHDDGEALEKLSVPANVLDCFEPWRWVREVQGAKEHIDNVEAARTDAEARSGRLRDEIGLLAAEARSLLPQTEARDEGHAR